MPAQGDALSDAVGVEDLLTIFDEEAQERAAVAESPMG
jgi:hypothetical protein